MRKLAPVEEAKELMIAAAQDWSIWRWLLEKKRVRRMADIANEALDEAEKKVTDSWSDEVKLAYRELKARAEFEKNPRTRRTYEKAKEEAASVPADVKAAVEPMVEADQRWWDAHMDAENTFEVAERRMSISMAREGAAKAVESWELHEKAIRKAEALGRKLAAAD